MNNGLSLRASYCGVVLSLLASCSGGFSATELSTRNSGFFVGRVTDNAMQGAYNPEGFTATQVQKLVSETCGQGPLTGFTTQSRSDGLVSFAATCSAWRDGARAVEYERSGGSGVVVEITGVVSGSITYSRISATI